MILKRDKVIEMLKHGYSLCEEIWGGYHYTIGIDSVVFSTARRLILSGQVIEDKTKIKSPLLKWYKWRLNNG